MENKLIELGIPVHLKGFNYLLKSLELIENNNMTQIYVMISQKNNKSKSSIERNLRYLKEMSFKNNYKLYCVFEKHLNYDKNYPTNKEFITMLLKLLK